MHLTNYAINKDSEGFIFNEDAKRDDVGHKRSMTSVLKFMDQARTDKQHGGEQTWNAIKDIIAKTIIAG